MKLSMMTLGCPTWDLATICHEARAMGYDGIDFRGVGETIDITTLPAFTTDAVATKRMLADHGLVISGISSSISVCDVDKRTQSLDEARRTLAVAQTFGAANVRVFGNGRPDRDGYAAAAAVGADCVRSILRLPGADRVSWNFETHDHWVRSVDCRLLLDAVIDAPFGAAWDIAHTQMVGHETIEQTLDAIGDRLRYVHVKDAVRDTGPDARHYVLPGQGQVELSRAVAALRDRGYDGWLMFEHEKRWHPELEPPEVAFPAFIRWAEAAGAR